MKLTIRGCAGMTGWLVFLAMLSAVISLRAQPAPANVSRDTILLTVSGKVEVAPPGEAVWTSGHTNQVLKVGDRLRTSRNSRATLRLSNLSVLRVYELTTLEIQPPQQEGRRAVLNLESGAAYFFNRDRPSETQFRTPSASGAIRGTEFNLAVTRGGGMDLALLDGQVDLTNSQGTLQVRAGEEATAERGQPFKKSPMINAVDIIQWTLFYPAILDTDELGLSAESQDSLGASLDAYRSGDLLQALAKYPEGRALASGAERVYRAALLLAVGNVDEAQSLLRDASKEERPAALADALREMIAAIKGQPWTRTTSQTLTTEWMAGSYQAQSRHNLVEALKMARNAGAKSPSFGFAQERIAELEFNFAHTDAALAALNKSLALSPRNAQALALKGFALSAQNKIMAATPYFDQAIEVDGALANGWLGRGLLRIRRNEVNEGRRDLETAAALEPNRAFLRSYLGKAWSLDQPFQYSWNLHLATNELGLAMRLDPNDPTAWLYAALLDDQRNDINQAIAELEHSEDLNGNRAVFRSRFALDQDQAVRSANLALIYEDAGFSDVAVREATKSVEDDYANYSAHLFLAESYDALQDPKKADLRYQTPFEDELLVANLLAPVGAGALSQNISQQEYSKLFEGDRLGSSSQTEFFSRGAWLENASQFGTMGNLSYSLDAYYLTDPGWRPNNDVENSDFSAKVKYQVTPKDTMFLQVERTEIDAGDVFQHFDYNTPQAVIVGGGGPEVRQGYDPVLHEEEVQDPNVLLGYHRDWGNGNHTLVLYRGLQDHFSSTDGGMISPFLISPPPFLTIYPGVSSVQSTTELNSFEVQHIYQNELENIIVGGRYQNEDIQTANSLFQTLTATPLPSTPHVNSDFERFSLYAYYQLKLFDSLRLTAGATYDREHYPLSISSAPFSNEENERERLSPKAGIDWTLSDGTRLRADYTRSMGGLINDSSTIIEPTEVAGFNQEFRSLIPESAGFGTPPATLFETWGLGADHKFPTGTYLDAEGQLLTSTGNQHIGVFGSPFIPVPMSVGNLNQTQYFQEKDFFTSLSQLVGQDVSVGVRYSLTSIDLTSRLETPPGTVNASLYNLHENSTLNEVSLYANYYLPCGFFSSLQANWWDQFNTTPGESAEDFWQFNIYAGYRFPRRHVEVAAGIINLLDQDYKIDPVTYFLEQAHTRTFVASLKFTF